MKLVPSDQIDDKVTFTLTWLERLTSWPWRPFALTETIIHPKFETIGNLVYCSPETFRRIRHGELQWPDGVTELDNR